MKLRVQTPFPPEKGLREEERKNSETKDHSKHRQIHRKQNGGWKGGKRVTA
jgi:hypothetical protein